LEIFRKLKEAGIVMTRVTHPFHLNLVNSSGVLETLLVSQPAARS
jgi:hypothetical protein